MFSIYYLLHFIFDNLTENDFLQNKLSHIFVILMIYNHCESYRWKYCVTLRFGFVTSFSSYTIKFVFALVIRATTRQNPSAALILHIMKLNCAFSLRECISKAYTYNPIRASLEQTELLWIPHDLDPFKRKMYLVSITIKPLMSINRNVNKYVSKLRNDDVCPFARSIRNRWLSV